MILRVARLETRLVTQKEQISELIAAATKAGLEYSDTTKDHIGYPAIAYIRSNKLVIVPSNVLPLGMMMIGDITRQDITHQELIADILGVNK